MRKVSREVVSAFLNRQKKAMGNTISTGQSLFLHGNMIARFNDEGKIFFTMAGWGTNVTRERLNAVFEMAGLTIRLFQKNHDQYLHLIEYGVEYEFKIDQNHTFWANEEHLITILTPTQPITPENITINVTK